MPLAGTIARQLSEHLAGWLDISESLVDVITGTAVDVSPGSNGVPFRRCVRDEFLATPRPQ